MAERPSKDSENMKETRTMPRADEYEEFGPERGRRPDRGDTDLVLAPGEYAYVLDTTKGHVNVIVGPYKASMSATDQTVRWESGSRRFRRCDMADAAYPYIEAREGEYLVLRNPAEADDEHPREGTSHLTASLAMGRQINISGPTSFALWGMQEAEVIPGHRLKSNQYLVVRVVNEKAAADNWGEAVMEPQAGERDEPASVSRPDSFSVGQLIVIRGTEVSFYIPPTGLEVVPEHGEYVRDAVSLERLEFCIRLDESGKKRFDRGPAVVFPEPTEIFVEEDGKRKFRAIELNPLMGIYVKVIADYTGDGKGENHKAGEELWITGADTPIYYPREEHAIVKYGDRVVHFAVAVPPGEGRYVLDRLKGVVRLVKGPTMLLPDPRKEVIVRRVLDDATVNLLYPGNTEALKVNQRLRALSKGGGFLTARQVEAGMEGVERDDVLGEGMETLSRAMRAFAAEEVKRSPSFTPPRTVTLDTKYDGAVSVDVWTGYALYVVSKAGKGRVIVGPQTVLLEYDERPMALRLSRHLPKTSKERLHTAFLRVRGNRVADLVDAETKDGVPLKLHLAYRVKFDGEDDEQRIDWFALDDYVGFLTEHLRSLLGGVVRQHGVEEFILNAVPIVRDAILGTVGDEGGERPGKPFDENRMVIYDVEVLDVRINNEEIAGLMRKAQLKTAQRTLEIGQEEQKLAFTQRTQEIARQIAVELAATEKQEQALKIEKTKAIHEAELADIRTRLEQAIARLEGNLNEATKANEVDLVRLEGERAAADQRLVITGKEIKQDVQRLIAEADALAKRAQAVSPQLTAALQAFADSDLAGKLATSMSPWALLGGEDILTVATKLLDGLGLKEAAIALAARTPGKPRWSDEDPDRF